MSNLNPTLYQSIKTTFNENLTLSVAICGSSSLTTLGLFWKNPILAFTGVFAFSVLVGVSSAYIGLNLLRDIWKQYRYHKRTIWMPMPNGVKKACVKLGLDYEKIKFGIRNDLLNAYTIGNSIVMGYPLMNQLEKDEELGIIAHELGHIKNRHSLKLTIIICIPYLVSTFCYLQLPEVMRGITALCMSAVIIIPVRWKFEGEADQIAKQIVGKDVVKSAFKKMLTMGIADAPSFSHPNLSGRIHALD